MAYRELATSIYTEALKANQCDNAVTLRITLANETSKLLVTQWDVYLIKGDVRIDWNGLTFLFHSWDEYPEFMMDSLLSKMTEELDLDSKHFNGSPNTWYRRDILNKGIVVSTSRDYMIYDIDAHDVSSIRNLNVNAAEKLAFYILDDEAPTHGVDELGCILRSILIGMKLYVIPMLISKV
jgi:hypothetical protein